MADIWHYLEIGNCLCAGNYEYETIKMLAEALENSKSAYDIDKVVKELYEERTEILLSNDYECEIINYCLDNFDNAIEIVKQGSVSDDTDNACEWKKLPFSWFAGCDGRKVEYKQGNYCPRCGKKIRIVGD